MPSVCFLRVSHLYSLRLLSYLWCGICPHYYCCCLVLTALLLHTTWPTVTEPCHFCVNIRMLWLLSPEDLTVACVCVKPCVLIKSGRPPTVDISIIQIYCTLHSFWTHMICGEGVMLQGPLWPSPIPRGPIFLGRHTNSRERDIGGFSFLINLRGYVGLSGLGSHIFTWLIQMLPLSTTK